MTLYLDCESAPLEHSDVAPRAVCAQIAVGEGPVELYSPAGGAHVVRDWIRRGGTVVGHNLPFDIAALGLEWPGDQARDTSIRGVIQGAAAGRHEAASSGLADLARPLGLTLTGKGSVQLSFRQNVPLTEEQIRYAKQDTEATRAVYKAQGGPTRFPDEARQTRISWDVWQMARRGVHLDVPRVSELVGRAAGEVVQRRAPLLAAGLIAARGPKRDPWRESSVDRGMVQARLRECGVTAVPKRRVTDEREPSGLLSAEGDVLRATGQADLIALADYKDAEKWAALVGAFDIGPVARARWKPMVASGRIACSGPNLTQVPRALRQCVIPSPGNVLVVADYSQLEGRVWADTCKRWLGWSVMAEAFNAGEDIHEILARQLGGDRQAAKAGNYGFIGGMGAKRAAATYGMTEAQALALRKAWRRTWPEWRPYFARIDAAAEGPFIHTTQGRVQRHRVRLPWSGRERLGFYSEAANFLIQGGGADVAKQALRRITATGLPVVMLGHDEFVLDCPMGEALDAARELARCMEEAGREVCPSVPWAQKVEIRERWGLDA